MPARLGRRAATGGWRIEQPRAQRASIALYWATGYALHRIGEEPGEAAVDPDKAGISLQPCLPFEGKVHPIGADRPEVCVGLANTIYLARAVAADQLAEWVGRAVTGIALAWIEIETGGQCRLRQRVEADGVGDADGIVIY